MQFLCWAKGLHKHLFFPGGGGQLLCQNLHCDACAIPNPNSHKQTEGGPVTSGSQVASNFLEQPS